MFITDKDLQDFDPELWQSISKESLRQEQHIELIASENYTSKGILEIQGSVLTNKYAEGYPGKRYYGGCENVDIAESLAISRAKELCHKYERPVATWQEARGLLAIGNKSG